MESLLLDELVQLGAANVSASLGGVYFEADLRTHYYICMWCRLANRILLWLGSFECADAEQLYAGAKAIDWSEHLGSTSTFAITFTGTNPSLRNTHFSAQTVKDAVTDSFVERLTTRPNVDTVLPNVRFNAHLYGGIATIRLDLSGTSLHRRGYRQAGGEAPLKENLACAILIRARWPQIASGGGALLDPLCGSGTLLIEGAHMAMGIAPGLRREHWGFIDWLGHVPANWQAVEEEAASLFAQAQDEPWPDLLGYDASGKAVDNARRNIEAAGLDKHVRVLRKDLGQLVRPTHKQLQPGLVVANPPYGERLGDEASLVHLYRLFGEKLRTEFQGWKGAIFTGNPNLGKTMGLRATKQYRLFNGPIAAKLLLFDVEPRQFVHERNASQNASTTSHGPPLSEGGAMFANRVRKNQKHLRKWRKRAQVDSYRVYDADLPEYAVAIDVYGQWAHVTEYKPPFTVEPDAARARLREILLSLPEVLDIAPAQIAVKERSRQRGSQQYSKRSEQGKYLEIEEGDATLLVNLQDYLDTGLFLDHRRVRLYIADIARGKRFLNLFSYTGAATVHAAVGGARFSTSVDLSSTYLDWAQRNLARNGVSEHRHRLVRADVVEWLESNREEYDVIFLDPPTFSNSKRTRSDFDVQEDHAEVVTKAMRALAPDGLLVFSCNRRRFTLNAELSERYAVEDVTRWSLDPDFERARFAHRCWFIRHSDTSYKAGEPHLSNEVRASKPNPYGAAPRRRPDERPTRQPPPSAPTKRGPWS
jgi:23S rRNA (guanine2445-N2)-methyltransferase / 23S rRNA (guanine2069-N7)-methyltransferase